MKKKLNNYAFIDSQNLNLSIRSLGWALDFARFRRYLKDKYSVTEAFLFVGYIEGNSDLYKFLQKAGFVCIFKPTLKYKDGTTKGNCDAELVLQAMIEYLNRFKFSALLNFKIFRPFLKFMNDLRVKLEYKKKGPIRTEP